jgi:hypothetical protein
VLRCALNDLADKAIADRDSVILLMDRTYKESSMTDVLALNSVYQVLQEKAVAWEYVLIYRRRPCLWSLTTPSSRIERNSMNWKRSTFLRRKIFVEVRYQLLNVKHGLIKPLFSDRYSSEKAFRLARYQRKR